MFRQHWYGAVYEVYARGALLRLLVNDGPFGDVVRHVGNVHAYLPELVAQFAYRQRVVEVFCVARVYGECSHFAEVLALVVVLLGNLARYLVGGFLHALRVLVWQSVLGEYCIHLDVVVALFAQYVDNLAYDVLVVFVRPFGHFHHGLLAGLAALQLVLGYDDVVGEDVAVGHEEGEVALNLQLADKRVARPFEYFGYHCLLDVVAPARHEGYADAVAGKRRLRVALGHEYWFAAVVRFKAVLTVRLAYEPAFLHLAFHVQFV